MGEKETLNVIVTMLKSMSDQMKSVEERVTKKVDTLEEKVDRKFSEYDQRLKEIEEMRPMASDSTRSPVTLRTPQGQSMAPNLFRELNLGSNISSQQEIDLTNLVNASLRKTLTIVDSFEKSNHNPTTEEVADKQKKTRSTVSTKLNMLTRLGLLFKDNEIPYRYSISPRGRKFLSRKDQ